MGTHPKQYCIYTLMRCKAISPSNSGQDSAGTYPVLIVTFRGDVNEYITLLLLKWVHSPYDRHTDGIAWYVHWCSLLHLVWHNIGINELSTMKLQALRSHFTLQVSLHQLVIGIYKSPIWRLQGCYKSVSTRPIINLLHDWSKLVCVNDFLLGLVANASHLTREVLDLLSNLMHSYDCSPSSMEFSPHLHKDAYDMALWLLVWA